MIEQPSNNVFIFLLLNVHIFIIIALLWIIIHQAIKLYLARKNNSIGSIFKRNLLVAFTIFAVVPAFSIFFLAGKLITKSVDYWFCSNVRSGLSAGIVLYEQLDEKAKQAPLVKKSLYTLKLAIKDFDQLRAMRRPIYLNYLLTLIFGTLIALLLAIWCAFYLARGISRPIKELLEAMEKMGKGEWNIIATSRQVSDLDKLILGFNAMSLQLKAAQLKLKAMQQDELVHVVKLNKIQTWQEAARQVAHEINNPLTPIQLATQRLQRKYATTITDPAFMDCTQTILQHVAIIKNLVSHFKEYGQMPELMLELLDINQLIQEVISLYRMSYPDIQFVERLEDFLPSIKADAQKIKRVIINLLENSISALNTELDEKKQKKITLKTSFKKGQQQIELLVSDNGPGISEEVCKTLFLPYVSTKSTHMGLGLAMIHEIIMQCRGSIKLLPSGKGGATFQILFPV